MSKKLTTEIFIERAKIKHKGKYLYDKSIYIDAHTPIIITCPIHGDFTQTPNKHLIGQGCPICAGNVKYKTEDFIRKARKVHGDEYLYDDEYVDNRTPIRITCKIHGGFWQTPSNHLKGCKCPKCAGGTQYTKDEFIKKARKVHGDKYGYNNVVYINSKTPVEITCRIHGAFLQTPAHHLHGAGCSECAHEVNIKTQRISTKDFIVKARNIHKDKYDYSKVEYVNYTTKICITCPEHGDFWQTPDCHLQGHGCPKCGNNISKVEEEINSYINEVCGVETKTRDRSLLSKRLECDILIPSHKLIIEYNGLHWHSENQGKDRYYHLNKTELAESKGYCLIHIFEDEWLEHKDIVLNKIRHFLGNDKDKHVIGARKCVIKTVTKSEVEPFLNTYHIQGFVPSTAYYGAFYEGKLVGVMTFKQEKVNEWNLTRFATDTNYRLPGLASKIFKQFTKDYNPMEVKTFLDRRWSHGGVNVYDRMGFKLTEIEKPDYRYVVGKQRLHKFGFRKQILVKKYGLALSMTEKEMTEKLGFYRIWDCGLYKYVWRREK